MTRRYLPPDPEKQNQARAEWAATAVRAFRKVTGADYDDAVSDLLVDLGHYCDREGMNFTTALRRASNRYHEETGGVCHLYTTDL